MFVLDTNVVSELRKAKAGKADRHVAAWRPARPPKRSSSPSSPFWNWKQTGVLLVHRPDPRQAAMLRTWLDQHVLPAFSGRVQAVDTTEAQRCAALHVPDPRSERDGLIAATAMVRNMTVATRNVADFAATGVALLNSWDSAVPPRGRKVSRPRR